MDKITVKSKIRCMIVEDEPLSIEIIEKYIGKIPGLDIIATCDNALDAIKILKEIVISNSRSANSERIAIKA